MLEFEKLLKGNLVHKRWLRTIKNDDGNADVVTIMVLSEIVYWYRPTVKDGLAKARYKADILQKDYSDLCNTLNLSKNQVRRAILKLEELGIITRVFRSINHGKTVSHNILYLKLNIDELIKVTDEILELDTDDDVTVTVDEHVGSQQGEGGVSLKIGGSIIQNRGVANSKVGDGNSEIGGSIIQSGDKYKEYTIDYTNNTQKSKQEEVEDPAASSLESNSNKESNKEHKTINTIDLIKESFKDQICAQLLDAFLETSKIIEIKDKDKERTIETVEAWSKLGYSSDDVKQATKEMKQARDKNGKPYPLLGVWGINNWLMNIEHEQVQGKKKKNCVNWNEIS